MKIIKEYGFKYSFTNDRGVTKVSACGSKAEIETECERAGCPFVESELRPTTLIRTSELIDADRFGISDIHNLYTIEDYEYMIKNNLRGAKRQLEEKIEEYEKFLSEYNETSTFHVPDENSVAWKYISFEEMKEIKANAFITIYKNLLKPEEITGLTLRDVEPFFCEWFDERRK